MTRTVYDFPSRSTGKTYRVTVTQVPERAQVAVRCNCPAFRYSQWHTCWHARTVVERHKFYAVLGGELYNRPGDTP